MSRAWCDRVFRSDCRRAADHCYPSPVVLSSTLLAPATLMATRQSALTSAFNPAPAVQHDARTSPCRPARLAVDITGTGAAPRHQMGVIERCVRIGSCAESSL